MTSILASTPPRPDHVVDKENQDDSASRAPGGRTIMSLRPRHTKPTMHPAPTSAKMTGKRMKSPYERPRRATGRPKGFRRPKQNPGPCATTTELDLGSMRNMSITQPKQSNRVQQDQDQSRSQTQDQQGHLFNPFGINPTHIIAPIITAKGGRRKPPPANLMIGGGTRLQRPLPGYHQAVLPEQAPLYARPEPILRIPSYKAGAVQEVLTTGSFPSVPGLSYTWSDESGISAVGGSTGAPSAGPLKMKVPLRLPRPPIMEVQQRSLMRSDPDVQESLEDARSRLNYISRDLLRAASLYRPRYPATTPPHSADSTVQSSSSASEHLTSPSSLSTTKQDINSSPYSAAPLTGSSSTTTSTGTIVDGTNSPDGPFDVMFDQTITFGLPSEAAEILDGEDGKGWFDLAGCEPDCCLAVRSTKSKPAECSEEEGKEYTGKLLPAHHLLYASQCARLPRRPGPPLDPSGFALPLNAAFHHDPTASDLPPLRTSIQLPLVHLKVPFPSQFTVLHQYLYLPDPARLLSTLLALPPSIVLPGQSASKPPAERLATLPIQTIVERLKNIHKMWSNVVHLGIKEDMLWKAMDRAWSVVIDACRARTRATETQQRLLRSQALPHYQQYPQQQVFHDSEQRSQQDGFILPSQPVESMIDPTLVGITHVPSGVWRIPAHLVHGDIGSAGEYITGLPVPPLPNHPKSAGIRSTGHVMGLPSHDEETGLAY